MFRRVGLFLHLDNAKAACEQMCGFDLVFEKDDSSIETYSSYKNNWAFVIQAQEVKDSDYFGLKKLLSDAQAKLWICPVCAGKGATYDHTEAN